MGIRLAVGQQTLDLHGEVRILYPQPTKNPKLIVLQYFDNSQLRR
jgi:hypothetical protein